jgi:4-hydroxy-4-methyl-2-oxoglutarate aldolase
MAKRLLGKLAPEAVGRREIARLESGILEGYRALGDLTGTTSDALDECGIEGVVPASVLRPTEPRARVVGQAVTVLNKNSRVRRKRQGEAGAVVDGAVRDIDHSRSIGYPVWCSGVSPITGKWRIVTLAVNKPIRVAGITVRPGDLVVADECGVCFVPYARAAEVLAVARRLAAAEKTRLEKLASGIALEDYLKLPR